MSCRKVSRELLERFRFGEELDARSAPHLRHLQSCPTCREEVGLDRALVIQLRRTLRARVEGYAPSAASWLAVRERALAADHGFSVAWHEWLGRMTSGLKAGGAVAAVVLVALVGVVSADGEDPVAQLQLRGTPWPGAVALANALPTDPPPYVKPRVVNPPTPLPPPAAGRFSVIMAYSRTGEAVATTYPIARPDAGRLR